jgi:hypothetical protein
LITTNFNLSINFQFKNKIIYTFFIFISTLFSILSIYSFCWSKILLVISSAINFNLTFFFVIKGRFLLIFNFFDQIPIIFKIIIIVISIKNSLKQRSQIIIIRFLLKLQPSAILKINSKLLCKLFKKLPGNVLQSSSGVIAIFFSIIF